MESRIHAVLVFERRDRRRYEAMGFRLAAYPYSPTFRGCVVMEISEEGYAHLRAQAEQRFAEAMGWA